MDIVLALEVRRDLRAGNQFQAELLRLGAGLRKPLSVSWSVSAKASSPASFIFRTSAAGESRPSETVEWLWRSIRM